MEKYEIEIKSLLGSKENSDQLVEKMKKADPGFKTLGAHKQLNHYFTGGSIDKLYTSLENHIEEDQKVLFKRLTSDVKNFSVRTRWADGKVIFVMKASVDDTTSSNGTARIEFESYVDMSLDELDKMILSCDFEYQAKWSREREDYKFKDLNVSIDKNAGYGYLAEFENVIDDPTKAEDEKSSIRKIMSDLGVEELNQDRLARMFDYYNNNWQNYYGTEKTFTVN